MDPTEQDAPDCVHYLHLARRTLFFFLINAFWTLHRCYFPASILEEALALFNCLTGFTIAPSWRQSHLSVRIKLGTIDYNWTHGCKIPEEWRTFPLILHIIIRIYSASVFETKHCDHFHFPELTVSKIPPFRSRVFIHFMVSLHVYVAIGVRLL